MYRYRPRWPPSVSFVDLHVITKAIYRARQKSTPSEKFYISEIVADIFTKFEEITDEDSVYISCKFY